MGIVVGEIEVADPAPAWAGAGFDVGDDRVCRVGGVGIRLVGRACGTGILGWSLDGLPPDFGSDDLDGVPTRRFAGSSARAGTHANGVVAIDHVVLASPHLRRTTAALQAVGATPRRERDAELAGRPMRQVFFRFGEVIVEVVGAPDATGDEPSALWGITYVVADVDATARFFGARAARVRDAVQPGRRITTLRHRDLGVSVRTAVISAGR